MIIDKEIKLRINRQTFDYYKSLGYGDLSINKFSIIKTSDLSNGSNLKLNVKCDICENVKELAYSKYIKNTKNLTEFYCCSNQCALNKQKETTFKNHGVEYPGQKSEIFEKVGKTKLEKYGDKFFTNKEKSKKTCMIKYGVSSSNKVESVKDKMRITLLKNYGVEHPTQNKEIFKKQQSSSFKVHQYKNSSLTYQGTFEKYFLEQMEIIGKLDKIIKGKSYFYKLEDGKNRIYHSDYLFNNITIEIKSSWTYNRNGKDEKLGLKNEIKWQTVRNYGDDIIILKSKEEIYQYIQQLK